MSKKHGARKREKGEKKHIVERVATIHEMISPESNAHVADDYDKYTQRVDAGGRVLIGIVWV